MKNAEEMKYFKYIIVKLNGKTKIGNIDQIYISSGSKQRKEGKKKK